MTDKAIDVLTQLKQLFNKFSGTEYNSELEVLSGATIGKHSRHIIEFFQCLIRQAATGTVNYDLRLRDPELENNPGIAIQEIDKIILSLQQMKGVNSSLQLETGDELNQTLHMKSSLDREIWYNVEHAIHHMAIIKMALNHHYKHIDTGTEFGIAISTLKYMTDNNISA